MLEDFSSELFYIMAKTYALNNLLNTDQSFLGYPNSTWSFEQFVTTFINDISKLKTGFLTRMDFNAHVSDEEYKHCVSPYHSANLDHHVIAV